MESEFQSKDEIRAFERTLMDMGVNPSRMQRKEESTLPPLPASDPMSIKQNRFDGFYQVGAREFWAQSEVTQNEVKEFQKCQHYLMKKNNEVICTKCHAGWVVNDTFQVIDGKLYNGTQELSFAV